MYLTFLWEFLLFPSVQLHKPATCSCTSFILQAFFFFFVLSAWIKKKPVHWWKSSAAVSTSWSAESALLPLTHAAVQSVMMLDGGLSALQPRQAGHLICWICPGGLKEVALSLFFSPLGARLDPDGHLSEVYGWRVCGTFAAVQHHHCRCHFRVVYKSLHPAVQLCTV